MPPLSRGAVPVTAPGAHSPLEGSGGPPGLGTGGCRQPLAPCEFRCRCVLDVLGFSPSFVSKFQVVFFFFVFFSLAGGLTALRGWKESCCGGPLGVGAGRGRAAAICPPLLGNQLLPALPVRGRGGSEPPSACPGTGVSPQARLAHGAPALGSEDGCPQPGWQEQGGDTFSRGAPGGRCWGLGGAGVHHRVRGEFQGVPAPSRILTGCKPSSRHP